MSAVACVVRQETVDDVRAIGEVHRAAFPSAAEAHLVDALRSAGALVLSLVAELEGDVVGHIAFSPVTITSSEQAWPALGLAPMAVAPAWQRRGVGARLIVEGLRQLRTAGHRACVVLGEPAYYGRYGFSRASAFGIRWEKPAPDAAFMAQELVPGALAYVSGIVRYRPEFDAV